MGFAWSVPRYSSYPCQLWQVSGAAGAPAAVVGCDGTAACSSSEGKGNFRASAYQQAAVGGRQDRFEKLLAALKLTKC